MKISHDMGHLTTGQLDSIHQRTVGLLEKVGVDLVWPPAAELMRKKGFRVDGTRVYINENQLMDAVGMTPDRFDLASVTSDRTVTIGRDHVVLASTSGATSVMDMTGRRRDATMADYENFIKLNHTSDVLEVMSPLIVQPRDLPDDTVHSRMAIRALTFSDKPCGSLSMTPSVTRESLALLAHCRGLADLLSQGYHTLFNVSVLSPMGYASDSTASLMTIAEAGQPMVIVNMALTGATAPMGTVDTVIMGNAEILAGLVLAQAIRPGLPVIYGSTSAVMDMGTMNAVMGAPETLQIHRCVMDLAKYYGLICRTGGSLTDAHMPDGRAMAQSALCLENAICHGAHFIMHACEMMSSYLGVGFEKWLMDEENARVILKSLEPPDFDTNDLSLMTRNDFQNCFLAHPRTLELCRVRHRSRLALPFPHDKWWNQGAQAYIQGAATELESRLGGYRRPDYGAALEKELNQLCGID